jgi:hypothetical protein
MGKLPFVYIAGPYTGGDVAANVHYAIHAAHLCLDQGLPVYCPHLSHFLHIQRARPYEEWMALDLAWLSRSDVLLRLPGVSPGADREVAEAQRLGIPVRYAENHAGSLALAVADIRNGKASQ